jgi:ankyrin repeat protein
MRSLLQKGANLDKPSCARYTPLMVAVSLGKLEAAKFLVSVGADPFAADVVSII